MDVPGGHGKGVFYWEPTSNDGRSFFDNDRNPRPIMDVFNQWTRPAHRVDQQ